MELYCCCCGEPLAESKGVPCLMTLTFPGEGEADCILLLCWTCSEEFNSAKTKPVVEALVTARIARLDEPEKSYKPGADGPEIGGDYY